MKAMYLFVVTISLCGIFCSMPSAAESPAAPFDMPNGIFSASPVADEEQKKEYSFSSLFSKTASASRPAFMVQQARPAFMAAPLDAPPPPPQPLSWMTAGPEQTIDEFGLQSDRSRGYELPSLPPHRVLSVVDAVERTEMTTQEAAATLVLIFLPALIAAIAAGRLDQKRLGEHPDTLPYKWGYFLGISWMLFVPFHIIFMLLYGSRYFNDPVETLGTSLPLALLSAVFSWFMVQRKRLPWVVLTGASLNPLLWLINGIYLKNRWAELKAEAGIGGKEILLGVGQRIGEVRKKSNSPQKTVVGLIIPSLIFLLTYKLMGEVTYRSPFDLDDTWWGWALAVIVIGLFEFFWLKSDQT